MIQRSAILAIALFSLHLSAFAQHSLMGTVFNRETKETLAAVLTVTESASKDQVAMYTSNSSGAYVFDLKPGHYNLKVRVAGYDTYERFVSIIDGKELRKDVYLRGELPEINLVFKGGAQYINTDVLFSPGSHELNEEAIDELNRIAPLLRDNESFVFEVGGHCSPDESTPNISMRRATVAFDYLVKKGIERARLSTKAYDSEGASMNSAIDANNNDYVCIKMLGKDFVKATKVVEKPEDRLYEEDLERISKVRVLFKRKKAKILSSEVPKLDSVKNFMVNFPRLEMAVKGYTDAKLKPSKQKELSDARTKAVVSYMSKNGVGKNRMTWRSYGKKDPVATSSNKRGRTLNNRVEFEITGSTSSAGTIVKLDREIKEKPKTSSNADQTFFDVLDEHGEKKMEGLDYVVQVGAFVNDIPETNVLRSMFDDLNGVQYPDGIWRYTTGKFIALEEANRYRNEVIVKGIKDAFVLAIHDGQRLTVFQLEQLLNK